MNRFLASGEDFVIYAPDVPPEPFDLLKKSVKSSSGTAVTILVRYEDGPS